MMLSMSPTSSSSSSSSHAFLPRAETYPKLTHLPLPPSPLHAPSTSNPTPRLILANSQSKAPPPRTSTAHLCPLLLARAFPSPNISRHLCQRRLCVCVCVCMCVCGSGSSASCIRQADVRIRDAKYESCVGGVRWRCMVHTSTRCYHRRPAGADSG